MMHDPAECRKCGKLIFPYRRTIFCRECCEHEHTVTVLENRVYCFDCDSEVL